MRPQCGVELRQGSKVGLLMGVAASGVDAGVAAAGRGCTGLDGCWGGRLRLRPGCRCMCLALLPSLLLLLLLVVVKACQGILRLLQGFFELSLQLQQAPTLAGWAGRQRQSPFTFTAALTSRSSGSLAFCCGSASEARFSLYSAMACLSSSSI